jgi:hypothetical protein
MEELKEFLNSVMNLDADESNLLPNETQEVYNSISDIEGNLRRFDGNTIVNNTLPAGVNTVVGTANDYSRNSIIYLVKNSLGNHCIFRYINGEIQKILYSEPILNFTKNINHINVIGDLLYCGDGIPRKINICKAVGTLNPFSHSGKVYTKYDVVSSDGKVYEYIGDMPGVYPLSDEIHWELKGRVYSFDRLEWILDRVKYPMRSEAPTVYYQDNP